MASTSTGLAEADEDTKTRAFEEMDRLDDEQILDELKGKLSEKYFYEIKDKESGAIQPGLSFAGTKWVAREIAARGGHRISVEHVDIVDMPDTIRVIAVVKDLTTDAKLIGVYEQERLMEVRKRDPVTHKKLEPPQYEKVLNRNAFTVAVSKAQRNGIRHHLDEPTVLALYEEWKKKKENPQSKAAREQQINATDKDSLSFELKDFLGVIVMEAAGELQVIVPAKALLSNEFMDPLKGKLAEYGAVYVPKSKDRGAYYSIRVG